MTYDLPGALHRRGLRVEVIPGWETRGVSDLRARGSVSHWTAGPRGATGRPSLNVVLNGRPDLAGPLCNVYLDRAGIAIVVAARTAQHAGAGGWKGLSRNSQVFGTECECGGDGDWTAAQRWAYPRVNAAYCDLGGFGPDMCCGHEEWAPTRKIDIRDFTMPVMRRGIAAVLEDDMGQVDGFSAEGAKELRMQVWGKGINNGATAEARLALIDARVAQILAAVTNPAALAAELAKLLPQGSAPSDAQLDAALKRVLGSLDDTPAA